MGRGGERTCKTRSSKNLQCHSAQLILLSALPQSVQALSCFYPLWTAEFVVEDDEEEEETGAAATRGPLANGINANAKRACFAGRAGEAGSMMRPSIVSV